MPLRNFFYPFSTKGDIKYWRCASTAAYGTGTHILQELSSSFSVKTLYVGIGYSASHQIDKKPSSAAWASSSDFTYSSTSSLIAINNTTGMISGMSIGSAAVTATHKVTGRTTSFTVEVVPAVFGTLISQGYIYGNTDIQHTDDGFYICTKSLADILWRKGISNTILYLIIM